MGRNVIHVETPHISKDKLLSYAKKYKPKCYCITPVNYDFVAAEFGINKTRKEFEKELVKIYMKLKKTGADLQLHVHLTQFPEMLPNEKKKNMLKEAYDFFVDKIKIRPREVVFGWYASDAYIENFSKNIGLKIIGPHFHTYDRWIK